MFSRCVVIEIIGIILLDLISHCIIYFLFDASTQERSLTFKWPIEQHNVTDIYMTWVDPLCLTLEKQEWTPVVVKDEHMTA